MNLANPISGFVVDPRGVAVTVARALFGLLVAVSLVAGVGCGAERTAGQRDGADSTPAASASLSPSVAQALRTCVDRWNQANMLGWGPALVSVSVRRLDAARLAEVGLRNPALPRCVVSLATEFRRDPRTGCAGVATVPGNQRLCVDRSDTSNCVINRFGAYICPTKDTARAPLRNKNATTNKRGVLKLDVPLAGTHPTPPLAWQRRYPHTDGWIEPWTRSGMLRPGLMFTANFKGGGSCGFASKQTHAKSAVRCVWRGIDIIDPCFPQRTDWQHLGTLVACPGAPGATTIGRFVISRRS